MGFAEDFKAVFEDVQRKARDQQAKGYEAVARTVNDGWVKALGDLIEDDLLRQDIENRAAKYQVQLAFVKLQAEEAKKEAVEDLATNFSWDKLADTIKLFTKSD